MTVKDTALELRLREHGIIHPIFTHDAAEREGLDLAAACAMLMMESAGGHNEFGHDWPFEYAGQEVTEERYRALRAAIDLGRPSTGVGPCQLTSVTLLDDADQLGGAWDIVHNLEVGFHYLRGLMDEHGVRDGFMHYNGSGPAAEAYANAAMEHLTTFQAVIAEQ
jgi:hypothetical protein